MLAAYQQPTLSKHIRYMRKANLIVCLLFLLVVFPVGGKNHSFQLIPKPQKMEVKSSDAWMFHELRYLELADNVKRPVMGPMLDLLSQDKQEGKYLKLILTDKNVPQSEEGYVLIVNKKGAEIQARHQKGLFYGCQTLEQLLEDSRDFNQMIPCMSIEDYPAISYRAVHWDTKHHLDRAEYYYQMIDKLAYYKINAVIWEIEDKLRYTRRPEIGAGNALSKQEIRVISRYAKERNVEISPLIQGLGHASFILKHHWELRENPRSDWEFCPSDPKTYELQFDLYRDALEAMPDGRYLHVGGDEITAIGIDERCKETGLTPFELQMVWLKKVSDFALENGRIPIIWDDMPLKYGDVWNMVNSNLSEQEVAEQWSEEKLNAAIELFPKECIYMRWLYQDPTKPGHKKILQWYDKSGLKVMAATAASFGGSPFLPREDTRSKYIKAFSELTEANGLEGILATAWDDGSPHTETVWRGYAAQGEFGWNPTGRSVEEYVAAHSQREYGIDVKRNSTHFIKELEDAFFFFDGALVQSGRRNPAWGTTSFKLLDLPEKKKTGEWIKKYEGKIKQAEIEDKRYVSICTELEKTIRASKRNRYSLYIYKQLNELQHFPVMLLLALAEYDKEVESAAKKEKIQKVSEICAQFKKIRADLEYEFSKIRFLEQPEGYVEDLNHHNHLSAKTMNFDWMYLYEIPMIDKINDWIATLSN